MNTSAKHSHRVMLREMSFDLCYRLRLAEDLFCQAADAVMAASAFDDFAWKKASSGVWEKTGACQVRGPGAAQAQQRKPCTRTNHRTGAPNARAVHSEKGKLTA